jgi:hypothetical protein
MRLHINPVLFFEDHERQILEEAFRPYRVLTGEGDKTRAEDMKTAKARGDDFRRHINRAGGELRMEWLSSMHTDLLELQEALNYDAAHWEREWGRAPKESSGLIAKPRQVCQMLCETRHRQAEMCQQALVLVRSAMEVLNPIRKECRQMAEDATKRLREST